MSANVSQPPSLPLGQALVVVSGKGTQGPSGILDPGSLQFALEWPQNRFLQAPSADGTEAWSTKKTWLRPASARLDGERLAFEFTPAHTWELRANINYLLYLRDSSGEALAPERLFWRAIRLPSKSPEALPDSIKVEEQSLPITLVVEPGENGTAHLTPTPAPSNARFRASRWRIGALGLLALICLGAAGVWYLKSYLNPAASAAPSSSPVSIDAAREFIRKGCDPTRAYTEAARYSKAGDPAALQGRLLLLDCAAKAGNAHAATEIGEMYDPTTFDKTKSAFSAPDADKAFIWYQRAADGNDADGLYRYGTLLLSGKVAEPGLTADAGLRALQRAAALGSVDAKKELESTNKKP